MKSILIQFDEDGRPTFFINAPTDAEAEKLRVIADQVTDKNLIEGYNDEN